jgi:hypothetical protein
MMKRILALALLLTCVAWARPQFGGLLHKKDDKKKQQQNPPTDTNTTNTDTNDPNKKKTDTNNNDQQQLFQGNVNATSSKQTSDTTAMGFSGLNPDGTVETAAMNATPTSLDYANAQKVATYTVDSTKLHTFIEDGKLKSKGGQ